MGSDLDGEAAGDYFGAFVRLNDDGNVLAVSGTRNDDGGVEAGHVRVFEWDGSSWIQRGDDIDGEMADDRLGTGLAINASGDVIAIGAPFNDNIFSNGGHVKIFEWNGTQWNQKGSSIDSVEPDESLGFRTDLDASGDTVVVSAIQNDNAGLDAGEIRVYDWNGSSWIQRGNSIPGEAIGDWIGFSVEISDDGLTLIGGAPRNNTNGTLSGSAYVFEWDGSDWVSKGDIIRGEAAEDNCGASVSINSDGSIIAVGAQLNDGGALNAGHVRVFEWDGTQWLQLGDALEGEGETDTFGLFIDLTASGDIIAVGARLNDDGGDNAGTTYIFQWDGTVWSSLGDSILGEGEMDQSGAVSLNATGGRIAIGAFLNDGTGTNAGHARVFEDPGLGVDDHLLQNVVISPNPTRGEIHLELGVEFSQVEVVLRNILGQLVSTQIYQNTNDIVYTIPGAAGLYTIELRTSEGIKVFKIIKR